MSLAQDSPEKAELSIIIIWITVLLSIFQTRFFLTTRALNWLLKFLSVLLRFLGRYSTKIAKLAVRLPQSMYQHNHSLSDVIQCNTFEQRTVCRACDSLYRFEECIKKAGSRTTATRCVYKPLKKCNECLMKEIVSSSGHRKFYPHGVFCFTSLYPVCKHLFYVLDLCSNVSLLERLLLPLDHCLMCMMELYGKIFILPPN